MSIYGRKGKYHHGDLRNALVEASLAIIQRDGAEALTLRSAAREAGVSHAAPYAHFEDKEDLIAAVKDEGFRELHAELQKAAAAAGTDPLRRLETLSQVYLGFASAQPAKYHILFRRPLAKDPHADASYITTGKAIFTMLADEVRALHAARPSRRGFTAEQVVLCSWSALHGLCGLWIDGPLSHIVPKTTSFEDLSGQFVRYVLSSLD